MAQQLNSQQPLKRSATELRAFALYLASLIGLIGCAAETPSELIRKEKAAGHHWQQYELAKQSLRADRSLLVAIGECYEHGWGALARDKEVAISEPYSPCARHTPDLRPTRDLACGLS